MMIRKSFNSIEPTHPDPTLSELLTVHLPNLPTDHAVFVLVGHAGFFAHQTRPMLMSELDSFLNPNCSSSMS